METDRCAISARMTEEKCRAYKSSGSLSCTICPGLEAEECAACLKLTERLERSLRMEKDLQRDLDLARRQVIGVRIERDHLKIEVETLKKELRPRELESSEEHPTILLRFIDPVDRELFEELQKICGDHIEEDLLAVLHQMAINDSYEVIDDLR